MNHEEFVTALTCVNLDERSMLLDKFIEDNKLTISASEIIAIAKMVCSASQVICPIINNL